MDDSNNNHIGSDEIAGALVALFHNTSLTPNLYNIIHDLGIRQRQQAHPNTFCSFGQKVFSQADEDGLIFEITRRLNIEAGNFFEIGVGNGLENNTLALLAAGWSGCWLGGEELSFSTERSQRLYFQKAWVTAENIIDLYNQQVADLGNPEIDLISLDLDGNDFYIAETLLEADKTPKIFVVEYNSKFAPPIRFTIDYDPEHNWSSDDYFGASICQFDDLFKRFGYVLVCCNAATGSNAFFVKSEFASMFPEVPEDIRDIYTPPNYNLYESYGHQASLRTIETIVNRKIG